MENQRDIWCKLQKAAKEVLAEVQAAADKKNVTDWFGTVPTDRIDFPVKGADGVERTYRLTRAGVLSLTEGEKVSSKKPDSGHFNLTSADVPALKDILLIVLVHMLRERVEG